MTKPHVFGYHEAALRLGVPIGVLRRGIRAGRIPAPPHEGATAALPVSWVEKVEKAAQKSPKVLSRSYPQKVPAFARYEGTSAWRKYTVRVREFAHYKVAQASK